MASENFEVPKDAEVRYAGLIALGALVFLVVVSRVFRDVNAG